MNELILIKLFILNKNIYNKYNTYINIDYYKKNYNELYTIYNILTTLYNNNTIVSSIEDFKALFFNELPSLRKAEKLIYDDLFNRISAIDVSGSVIDTILEAHRTRSIASEIAQVAWDTSNGIKSLLDLQESFKKGMDELGSTIIQPADAIEFVTDDIDVLMDKTFAAPGLKWRLKSLRRMMGSLRQGNFGFIFARPEAGKTTLLADMGSYFASQMEKPYLHCNNEEYGYSLKIRYIQAALGQHVTDINTNRQQAYDNFMKITKGNVKILDRASLSRQEIEDVCKKLNPGMIVIDSIDKVKGFEEDRDDLVYKKIYSWARELSKEYGPVIGVCHASAGGEGKEWLEMDDVAYAKCMDPETPVLLHNGKWTKIKDVNVGDELMGPDSLPRKVLNTSSGEEEMFKVEHIIGGDSYIVNKSHILTLKHQDGSIRDVPLTYYMENPTGYFGIRSGYTLPPKNLPLDPRWFGMWLGDGKSVEPEITTIEPEIKEYCKNYALSLGMEYVEHSNGPNIQLVQAKIKYKQGVRHPIKDILKDMKVYNNKHIPDIYLESSQEQRLELLAGLIDTDGTLVRRKHFYYEFSNKNRDLAHQVKKLALSCGFMSTCNVTKTALSLYWKVRISGDIKRLPCIVERKRCPIYYKPKKDILCSRLRVTSLGIKKYSGVVLDGDSRYIIDNCIVTHNTAKQGEADWILGIGRSYDNGKEYIRSFHMPKNKLMGDEDFIEEYRHGKIRVQIQPEIARYEDIMFKDED